MPGSSAAAAGPLGGHNETGKATIRYGEDCMVRDQCALDCPVDAITVTSDKSMPLIVSWR